MALSRLERGAAALCHVPRSCSGRHAPPWTAGLSILLPNDYYLHSSEGVQGCLSDDRATEPPCLSCLASGNLETESWEEVAKHRDALLSQRAAPNAAPRRCAGEETGTGTGSASALITAATSKKWGI